VLYVRGEGGDIAVKVLESVCPRRDGVAAQGGGTRKV